MLREGGQSQQHEDLLHLTGVPGGAKFKERETVAARHWGRQAGVPASRGQSQFRNTKGVLEMDDGGGHATV